MWHYTKVKLKQSLYWPLAFQDVEATRFQDNQHIKDLSQQLHLCILSIYPTHCSHYLSSSISTFYILCSEISSLVLSLLVFPKIIPQISQLLVQVCFYLFIYLFIYFFGTVPVSMLTCCLPCDMHRHFVALAV